MKLTHASAAILLAASLASCASPNRAEEKAVSDANLAQTETGKVKGVQQEGVIAFKGIPYAAPPVGDLRWRAPQPAKSWDGTLEATAFGHDCMQIPFAADEAPLTTTPAEDCLYVNVWKPADAKEGDKLPVLFWIYGGGWVNGGSSPSVYDGAPLAEEGLVVVSFNYRLGRFGFFAHPALTAANEDNGLLGNYGYLDQIAALEWVNENIAAFGGDSEKITIMGESAGGSAVLNLMTTPLADGLFEGAIAMSAPARMDAMQKPVTADDRPDGEDDGVGFAKWAGITGDGPDALKQLRALPAETIVAGTGMASKPVAPASGPMIDGTIITGPSNAFEAGREEMVPLMIGTTSMDLGFGPPLTPDELFAGFSDPESAREAYAAFSDDPSRLRQAIYSDMLMAEPARFVANAHTAQGQPVWYYRFGYVADSKRGEWPGAPHATDIPYFMDTVSARYGDVTTEDDREAAAQMSDYVVSFVKIGDPSEAAAPDWLRYEPVEQPILLLTKDGPELTPDPLADRLDAVETWSMPEPGKD